MPQISKVGDGWGGSEDYATLALWWAAESGVDYGIPIEAECFGGCGSNFTLSGASANGVPEIYTSGVQYDGSNESSLAVIEGLSLQTPMNIRDIFITSNNQFVAPFSVDDLSDGSIFLRLRVDIPVWSGVDAISTTGSSPNSLMSNCVVSGGVNCFDFGFNQQLPCINVMAFGSDGDGFEGSGNVSPVENCFAFNNGANDFVSVVQTNNASEDLTGTFTGYASAELVDFANSDFRTKSTSALATLGTGGTFIGAFLESGGPTGVNITTTEVLNSFADSATADVSINVQLSVTESLQSFIDVANVNITPNVVIDVNVTESLNSYDDLSQVQIVEAGQVGVSVTETLNSFEDSSIVDVSANVAVAVTESLNSFSDSSNVIIQKEIEAQVTEQLSSFIDSANVKVPLNITFNPKAVIRVNRKSNTVRVGRKSNTVRIK